MAIFFPGFIVVAACVMTFEARDSAAKVVPARFKPSLNLSSHRASTKSSYPSKSFQRMESKRNTSSQTGGNRSLGVHKMDSLKTRHEWSPKNDPCGRKALTSAFVQVCQPLNVLHCFTPRTLTFLTSF